MAGPVVGPVGIILLGYLVALNLGRSPLQFARQWLLRTRLLVLLLTITTPLLTAGIVWVVAQAMQLVEANEARRLEALNAALLSNAELWYELHTDALSQLVSAPAIVSMDPAQQKSFLKIMAQTHPDMYLVSTLNLTGMNVTRSDALPLTNYADQSWFQAVQSGAPQVFQVVVESTAGIPALIGAMPIYDSRENLVGVGMFACALTDMASQMRPQTVGNTGYAYMVDSKNRLLVHPDPTVMAQAGDLGEYPSVKALRAHTGPLVKFESEGAGGGPPSARVARTGAL
jgi:methyl-accepting chemotaxis protein